MSIPLIIVLIEWIVLNRCCNLLIGTIRSIRSTGGTHGLLGSFSCCNTFSLPPYDHFEAIFFHFSLDDRCERFCYIFYRRRKEIIYIYTYIANCTSDTISHKFHIFTNERSIRSSLSTDSHIDVLLSSSLLETALEYKGCHTF